MKSVFVFIGSVFAFDNQQGETISLLQTHATKWHVADAMVKSDEVFVAKWADGFNKCREQPQGTMSSCRIVHRRHLVDSDRECALVAARDSDHPDTFNYYKAPGSSKGACWLLRCAGTNMRFTRRVRKPWETYSRYCGLPSVSKNITVTCGKGKEDLVESSAPVTFPPPRAHACASPLNFGRGMKGNNLAGLGPGRGSRTMRFREVLPGVDLRIQTTDQYKPTNTKRNGRYKRWGGAVNVGPNTDTHFLFSFVNSSDGRRRVMVDSFMFTVSIPQQILYVNLDFKFEDLSCCQV